MGNTVDKKKKLGFISQRCLDLIDVELDIELVVLGLEGVRLVDFS